MDSVSIGGPRWPSRAPDDKGESAMRRCLPSAVAVLVVVVLLWFGRSPGQATPVRSCVYAVTIDGVLRCDDEIPVELAAVCSRPRTAVALDLLPGDAIETNSLCTLEDPHRGGPGWGRMAPADLRALSQPVDVNGAALDELRSLPGVGPKIAARIVEGRPYADVDALIRVRGIGPKTLARLRPRLVAGASP